MESKFCTKCGEEKMLCEFYKHSKSKDGHKNHCKNCMNSHKKEWNKTNPDKKKEYNNVWLHRNPDKKKESDKNWVANNKERKLETQKKWNAKNIDKIRESARKSQIKLRLEKPHIIIWRKVLSRSLSRLGKTKEGHTIDLLGYSAEELKIHLESLFTDGMSWDNYGEWHIDHITLLSTFDDDTPISTVNALSNIRPMWSTTREINGVVYEGNLNRPKY
jgi:hypothetical protein